MLTVSPLMWPSVSNAARKILNDLSTQSWRISENDFKVLLNYCLLLHEKKHVLRLTYYFQLQAGLLNTTNGSPEHGCYLALIRQFEKQYPNAISSAITSNTTTQIHTPCA